MDKLSNLSKDERLVCASLLVYVLFCVLFYPSYYLVNDEHHYLRGAYLLTEGNLWVEDELQGYHFPSDGVRYFPRYPPGMYLLLAPFILFGLKPVFVSGMILHVLGVFVFLRLLKRLNVPSVAALLYLAYPPFVYYSFTIFTDYHLTFFILLGWYLYLSKKSRDHFLAGLCFGFAFLLKVNAFVFFLGFFALALWKNWRKFAWMLAGSIPFGALHLAYNWFVYGSPFLTAYAFWDQFYGQGSNPFVTLGNWEMFFVNLFYQLVLLSLLYPGMVFVLFSSKNREVLLNGVIALLFFSMIVYTSEVSKPTLMLVVQYRYILPLTLFLIPGYYVLLSSVLSRLFGVHARRVYFAIVVLLFILCGLLTALIQASSERNERVAQSIMENTPPNSLIFGKEMSYFLNEFYARDYRSVRENIEGSSYRGYETPVQELIDAHNVVYLVSEDDENATMVYRESVKPKYFSSMFKSFDLKFYLVKNESGASR